MHVTSRPALVSPVGRANTDRCWSGSPVDRSGSRGRRVFADWRVRLAHALRPKSSAARAAAAGEGARAGGIEDRAPPVGRRRLRPAGRRGTMQPGPLTGRAFRGGAWIVVPDDRAEAVDDTWRAPMVCPRRYDPAERLRLDGGANTAVLGQQGGGHVTAVGRYPASPVPTHARRSGEPWSSSLGWMRRALTRQRDEGRAEPPRPESSESARAARISTRWSLAAASCAASARCVGRAARSISRKCARGPERRHRPVIEQEVDAAMDGAGDVLARTDSSTIIWRAVNSELAITQSPSAMEL